MMRHSTAQLQGKLHNLAGKQEVKSQSLDVSVGFFEWTMTELRADTTAEEPRWNLMCYLFLSAYKEPSN